jgi:5-methyltetrahydrofolate--homocysteine methyltransferase
VFKLLPVERDLGMELTSAFQLIPEQSTAAIIVHHPDAKYYAVRGTAGDASVARAELTTASGR